jgi:hypothetical protein
MRVIAFGILALYGEKSALMHHIRRGLTRVCLQLGELYARTDQNQTQNTSTGVAFGIPKSANV